MDASHLFTAALRLRSPWRVGSADFRDADVDGREPHITIGFEPGRGFMLLFEAWVWLYRLCSWMMHSRLEPMKELARLFRRHFATIIYLTCGSSHPDVYLEVQHPCWSCNSNSSSANASAGVR